MFQELNRRFNQTIIMITHNPEAAAACARIIQMRDGHIVGITTELAHDLTAVARDRFGVDSVLTTCNQVHGKRAERANASKTWRECDSCDALWTDEKATALGIKVADCLPVTMVDPTSAVIANAHSGWRGAVQRITAETIDAVTSSIIAAVAAASTIHGKSKAPTRPPKLGRLRASCARACALVALLISDIVL